MFIKIAELFGYFKKKKKKTLIKDLLEKVIADIEKLVKPGKPYAFCCFWG